MSIEDTEKIIHILENLVEKITINDTNIRTMHLKLDSVSNKIKKLSERIDNIEESQYRVEDKTDDIHSLVPFGRWFEGFSRAISDRVSFLGWKENDNLSIEYTPR